MNKAHREKRHMTSLPVEYKRDENQVQAWDLSGLLQGREDMGRCWPEAVRHHLCRMSRHGDSLEMTMRTVVGCFEITESMPGTFSNSKGSLEKVKDLG